MNPNDLAFPMDPVHTPNNTIQCGLTKREYIATQIAAGIVTNYDQDAQNSAWTFEATAMRAVKIADALLAELAKGST